MFKWHQHLVCYAEGPEGAYVLLAVRPGRFGDPSGRGEVVAWHDGTKRQTLALGKVLVDDSDKFEFEDDRGRRFSLLPLTPQLYEQKVRRGTAGPELKSNEALRDFFLK